MSRYAFGFMILLGLCDQSRAGIIHDYEFNNTLADSLGGPALVNNGAIGTFGAGGYTFGAGQGLSLSNGLTVAQTTTYSIEMVFSLADLSGFRKLIDFKNLASDNGLYNLSRQLNYFNVTTESPTTSFTANVPVDLFLTRNATTGVVTGYVNGTQRIQFTDTTGDATFTGPNAIINFFQDDNVTGGREAIGGTVSRIRIYDTALSAGEVATLSAAVPEPGSMTLLGLGAVGMLGYRLRRRKAEGAVTAA